ncbi:MAG: ATP-binding protein [Caulobacteraceae bacterium]|nr:ATP-binding protein [Caulobacteraceae bacterium]
MSDQDPSGPRKRRLEAIKGVDPEAARATFDRIAFLVQCFAGAPIVQVCIMDDDRVWTTGVSDAPLPPASAGQAFVSQVIGGEQVLWVEDARRDRRLRHTALVAGPTAIRFLAGAPIRLSDGVRIGAVSILDRRPRPFDAFLAARLEDFAALIAEDWDRRRAAVGPGAAPTGADEFDKWRMALAQAAPIALVMTDRDLRVIRASPRWLADRGLDGEAVVGRRLDEVFPGPHGDYQDGIGRALAGEPARWDRARLVLPDGRRLWVRGEAAPWREADGSIGGLLIKSADITDMVEAVEAARRSEQRLRLATDLAELRVWEADFTRRRLTSFGAALGGDVDDVVEVRMEDDLWRGVHPADLPAAKAQWRRHLAEGAPFRASFRILQVDGPHIWVAAAAEAVRGPDGQVERIVGVLKNIDREKRSEQAMAKALQAAEAANRAKSEFLANMSHEIRTPLNGVMGIASALGRTDLAPVQREMVELIGASAHTLEALLSDVLDLARIESGRLALRDEPFDLGDSLRLVAGLFEARAKDKGLAFRTTISPAARTMVRGDVVRLRQIVSNLLSNAVKFTQEGRVSLQVEAERADGRLRVGLSVIDTGMGFDAEVGRRLFQRFEQADGSITRRFGGAGLGLAISRSLADAMGGALTASATPGKGAIFTLKLELACAEEQAPAEPEPPDAVAETPAQGGAAPPPPMRVLLAEDHPTNRKVVSLILQAIGADLVCVENGALAVEAASRESFDLILMDMQMPVLDGLDAIVAIRAQEQREGRERTPILTLTANAMAENADASAAAGADGRLTKPIAAERLIAAVRGARRPQPPTVSADGLSQAR